MCTHPRLTNKVPGHLHGVLRKLKVAPGLSARLRSLRGEGRTAVTQTLIFLPPKSGREVRRGSPLPTKGPKLQLSFADLPIDAESAGLFTQLDGRHPRYFSGLLDVGTVSPDGQAHQVLSHGELLLEGGCQLLTCLEGKRHSRVRGGGTPDTCPGYLTVCESQPEPSWIHRPLGPVWRAQEPFIPPPPGDHQCFAGRGGS